MRTIQENGLYTKSFRVFGTPIPQGSVRGFVRGKRAVLTSDNPKLKGWRKIVTETAQEEFAMQEPFEGNIDVFYIFYMPRPVSVSLKKRPKPNVKPDLDKLVRAVNDSLTDAHVFSDDSRIVEIHATKLYADEKEPPGVWLSVGEQQ